MSRARLAILGVAKRPQTPLEISSMVVAQQGSDNDPALLNMPQTGR